MAILRVKDKNGNVTDIPAIQGKDGMTAYEGAVANGYKGTEAEFYISLAETEDKVSLQQKLDYALRELILING